MTDTKARLQDVARAFRIEGAMESYEEIKIGNVNRTYRVNFVRSDGKRKSYIAQRINTYAFHEPEHIMANIDKVTEAIHAKAPAKKALHFHHTEERRTFWYDEEGGFWRLFNYIESDTYNATDNMDILRNAGLAFGEFQMLLSDFDVSQLYYTIPDFHNTRARYAALERDVAADAAGRLQAVRGDVDWLLSVKERACRLTDLYDRGELPLRVTHNDTKINNVLFDKATGQALVVIDLDTVMPGLVGHDFGDAIRFAANRVAEDCPESDKADLDMRVYEAFADGFLSQTARTLTDAEIDSLALSGFSIACELATRFLADYLNGDRYFNIQYPEHNLARARCQSALARRMLARMDEMERVVRECVRKYR